MINETSKFLTDLKEVAIFDEALAGAGGAANAEEIEALMHNLKAGGKLKSKTKYHVHGGDERALTEKSNQSAKSKSAQDTAKNKKKGKARNCF